jgi:hypothetical protein
MRIGWEKVCFTQTVEILQRKALKVVMVNGIVVCTEETDLNASDAKSWRMIFNSRPNGPTRFL